MLVKVVSKSGLRQAVSGQRGNGPTVTVTVAQALTAVLGMLEGPEVVIVALGQLIYAAGSAGLAVKRVEGMMEL